MDPMDRLTLRSINYGTEGQIACLQNLFQTQFITFNIIIVTILKCILITTKCFFIKGEDKKEKKLIRLGFNGILTFSNLLDWKTALKVLPKKPSKCFRVLN